MSGQFHAPAAFPQGKSSWYPLDRRLGGPRAVLDAVMKKEIPTTDPTSFIGSWNNN